MAFRRLPGKRRAPETRKLTKGAGCMHISAMHTLGVIRRFDENATCGDGGRVSDRVFKRLMARIASGEWPPGRLLPGERRLAEEMGASRVSVRAALQMLKTKGFLDAVQGGGTRVVVPAEALGSGIAELAWANRDNLLDLLEMRGVLEVWAVRRAAANATPAVVSELSAILDGVTDDPVADRQADWDQRFHQAIARAAGSGLYAHLMGAIRSILGRAPERALFSSQEVISTIRAHHRAILHAIGTGNAESAAAAMATHLGWELDRYRAAG